MSRARHILIVGGVAGGMSCATQLRRLDENAKITVIEKGPFISYANCGIPYALGGVIHDAAKLHVQTTDKIHAWFDVDVRTNNELLGIDRQLKTAQVRGSTGAVESLSARARNGGRAVLAADPRSQVQARFRAAYDLRSLEGPGIHRRHGRGEFTRRTKRVSVATRCELSKMHDASAGLWAASSALQYEKRRHHADPGEQSMN